MKRVVYPNITILIVTLNNIRSIPRCIDAIRNQDYPKKNIELLNIDGGSTDGTVQYLKKSGFRSVKSPVGKDAEAQRGVGIKLAKHNLIVSLDADNYLPVKHWLTMMVRPFMEDPRIVHAGTLHFHYQKTDAVFNRYNALFGAIDPIVYYVGRPDRKPQYIKTWTGGTIIRQTGDYTTVEFSADTLPTVGCNGVVYRKDLLLKHAKSDPSRFLHIDVFADLVAKGYNRFAVVNTSVIHDTAVSLGFLMKKRIAFLEGYYLKHTIQRRYLIYNPSSWKDRFRLAMFLLYTVTLVKPLFDSLVGFMYIRDTAWFLHPAVCIIYVYAYGLASFKKKFRNT